MKITYQAGDGYLGNRPITFTIDDAEIKDCQDAHDAMEMIEDAIQDHFSQNVSADYNREALKQKVLEILNQRTGEP